MLYIKIITILFISLVNLVIIKQSVYNNLIIDKIIILNIGFIIGLIIYGYLTYGKAVYTFF